jgi:pilus assembly protein CpaC
MSEMLTGDKMADQGSTFNMKCVSRLAMFAALISLCVSGAYAGPLPVPGTQDQKPAPAETVQASLAAPLDVPAQAAEGPQSLHLLVGRSLVITSPTRIKRVSLADNTVAEAIVVSPLQVVLNGKTPGTISLLLWDENEQSQIFEVTVDIDILSLSEKVRQVFPTEPVQLEATHGIVMISGRISSPEVAARILDFVKNATPKVTSLMEVPAPPMGDILLEVKFAEVDRTALSQLGINLLSLPGSKNIGAISTQQFSPPQLQSAESSNTATGTTTVGQTGAPGVSSTFNLSDLLNIFIFRPDIDLAATIKALQARDVLQILAEPNLLTASGKDASFLAGGEFPYPVLQGGSVGGGAAITIQFREFGVRLNFTPTLEVNGTIHLKVKPEVSSLDFANALTIQGFVIPALSTRRVESEMDLKDGQSFAIAGLVDNRVTEELQKIPGLGDVPLLGKLFQSRSLNKSRNELMVLVTPRLVQPLTSGQLPAGPAFPRPFLEPALPAQPKTPGTN